MMTEESLKEKILETFRHLKQVHVGREKSKRNLYFNNIHQVAVCIKTSKVHLDNPTQKYWYTVTSGEKSFLEKYKNSYLFLGCLDNSNTAYLIPFHSYKRCFDTAETRWHININHQLYWRCSKGEDINLSQFKVPLLLSEETGCNREIDLLKALEKKHKKLFSITKKTERLKTEMVDLCKEAERLKTDIRDLFEYVTELYIEYLDLINKHKKN